MPKDFILAMFRYLYLIVKNKDYAGVEGFWTSLRYAFNSLGEHMKKIIIIGLFLVIIGCETNEKIVPKSNVNLPQLKDEWERNYTAWKLLQIQNYKFAFNLEGISQTITVKDGNYQSAIDLHSGELGEPHFKTIDALFDSIGNDFSINEKKEFLPGQIGTYFSVHYDPAYHYPVKYDLVNKFDKRYGSVGGNGFTIEILDFTLFEE